MTIRDYLKRHKGICFKPRGFKAIPINFVVTYRISKKACERDGRPIDLTQRVLGFYTRNEAERTAIFLRRQGAIRVQVKAI